MKIKNDENLIVDYYLNKTNEYKEKLGSDKVILLLQVGTFYEIYALKDSENDVLYGSDAEYICNICDLNIPPMSSKRCSWTNDVVHQGGFNIFNLDKYIKKIQDVGYINVVYNQDPNDAKKRSLFQIFTPGTFINTSIYDNSEKNIQDNLCMCIWIDQRNNTLMHKNITICGVSVVNINTGKSYMYEYNIQNETVNVWDNLEKFVSIHMPTEVIIVYNCNDKIIEDMKYHTNLIKFCKFYRLININDTENMLSKNAINCEKQIYRKELMNKFYDIIDYSSFTMAFDKYEYAFQSFCFLINFMYNHNSNITNNIDIPIYDNIDDRLILENHTLLQLNIIDDSRNNSSNSSLCKIINKCSTPMGKRKTQYELLHPHCNIEELNKSYEETQKYLNVFDNIDIKIYLRKIIDLEKWKRLLSIGNIEVFHFFKLYETIKTCSEINNEIYRNKLVSDVDFKMIDKNIHDYIEYLENMFDIENCKDHDKYQGVNKTIFMHNTFEELDDYYNNTYLNTYNQIEKIIYELGKTIDMKEGFNKYIKLCYRKDGVELETTLTRSKTIKNKLGEKKNKYIPDDLSFKSKSGNIVLVQSKKINALLISLYKQINEYNKIQADCFKQIQQIILNNNDKNLIYKSISQFIEYVDVTYNKAFIAKNNNYCKPEIRNNHSFIDAKDMRHPIIEKINSDEIYVPNDVYFDENNPGKLLYGTNAVGKTSYIRSIGMNIILAQSGFYVPCNSFVFYPYKYLFTRILNTDNLFKGLSTFNVEMLELKNILNNCDDNSLILGDELCSGTEIRSGYSIFLSSIEIFLRNRSNFIFATHMHEIINYEELKDERIKLQHMEISYDRLNDALVYDRKIKDGPGNQLYGLEVCKSLHMSEDFITRSFEIRDKYDKKSRYDNILNNSVSHYNSKKVLTNCEICGNQFSDVHHMQYQKNANDNNIINHFHKNHPANLKNLCEKCHNEIHTDNIELVKKKTTKGFKEYKV
jgi:DNA mismatch repair protein MutS